MNRPLAIQRAPRCSTCEDDKRAPLATAEVSQNAAARLRESTGDPLPPSTRSFMQARFGHDFSHVRVHTDDTAAESAAALSARAFTLGHDVAFGAGQYAPGTTEGQKLIAHELAHVAQQGGALPAVALGVSAPGDPAERAADLAAERVTAGSDVSVAPAGPQATVFRDTSIGAAAKAAADERCHPTQRIPGGITWLGTLAHLAISADAAMQMPGAEFEYHIPRSSQRNRSGYVDVAWLQDLELYEIKPLRLLDEANEEVERYVDRANQYCGDAGLWIRGITYRGGGPLLEIAGFELYSDLTLSGCITYEWVPGAIIESIPVIGPVLRLWRMLQSSRADDAKWAKQDDQQAGAKQATIAVGGRLAKHPRVLAHLATAPDWLRSSLKV